MAYDLLSRLACQMFANVFNWDVRQLRCNRGHRRARNLVECGTSKSARELKTGLQTRRMCVSIHVGEMRCRARRDLEHLYSC